MTLPIRDPRDRRQIAADLRARADGYVPGWIPGPDTPGAALLDIFSRQLEILAEGINGLPERHLSAYLDSWGTEILSAQPARLPLVFNLLDGSPDEVLLPSGSRVAAPVPSPPPSPLPAADARGDQPVLERITFATEGTVSLTAAELAAVYSVDPAADAIVDHTDRLQTGFGLFDGWTPAVHAVYFGHDTLFALADDATLHLSIETAGLPPDTVRRGLGVGWEYWGDDDWQPLTLEEDTTEALTRSGTVTLRKDCGPNAATAVFGERTSYWIRGVLTTPLPPESGEAQGRLPTIDTATARVSFFQRDLQLDAAFADVALLDVTSPMSPFGAQPQRFATFYISCEEAFQRPQAELRISVTLAEPIGENNPDLEPELIWEYSSGNTWRVLDVDDGTANLTASGDITFRCPTDWGATDVNGTGGLWLRTRLNAGDYGRPLQLQVVDDGTGGHAVDVEPSTLTPPVISALRIRYDYLTQPTPVDHCLALNNDELTDHSADCRWPRSPFEPFVPLDDHRPAVYLAFDRGLPPGLISLYVQAPETSVLAEDPTAISPFLWEYRAANGWTQLAVRDETHGFQQSGTIQFVGPGDAVATAGEGGSLYRVRARLKQGEPTPDIAVSGLWLNAVWATHRDTVEDEVVGTSDGNPSQVFPLQRRTGAIFDGEIVEVREWSGVGEDWRTAVDEVDDELLRFEHDPVTGEPRAVWVRWQPRPHLYGSSSQDRHYQIDRSTGLLRFGDGERGRIPVAGGKIVASYDSGGGLVGNVGVGTATELHAGTAYVESVSNPVAGAGGAEAEPVAAALTRGPHRLAHRGRAVCAADYEWLAREASPAVCRARCLPLHGPAGFVQRGWVTVHALVYADEPEPQLPQALKRAIREHLAARAPAFVAPRIRVAAPAYTPVSVIVDIVPEHAGDAAVVESRVREALTRYLHPAYGGRNGVGWDFGEALYFSQLAAHVEGIDGVDYATRLYMRVRGAIAGEAVWPDDHGVIASAEHEIRVSLGEG